jgi:hypothetical protein
VRVARLENRRSFTGTVSSNLTLSAIAPLLCDERVSCSKVCESVEVSVGTPEFSDAVMNAQSCDAGIVDTRPGGLGSFDQSMKHVPVAFRLGEHHEHWGLEPG